MVHSDLSNAKLLQKGDFGSWIRTDKLKKIWIWIIFSFVKMERMSTCRVIFGRSNLYSNHGDKTHVGDDLMREVFASNRNGHSFELLTWNFWARRLK